jgi:hypothetical protein
VRSGSQTDPEAVRQMLGLPEAIAHELDARQGHSRRKLLRESVHEVPIGVLCKPLKRHSPSSGIAHQTLQLIPPRCRNPRVGVQRKALDTGTAAMRCFTKAAMVRASSGSGSSRGAYPVAASVSAIE